MMYYGGISAPDIPTHISMQLIHVLNRLCEDTKNVARWKVLNSNGVTETYGRMEVHLTELLTQPLCSKRNSPR